MAARQSTAPTPVTAASLQAAFDYWNKKIFRGTLPREGVLIVWSNDPKLREGGQFTAAKWTDANGSDLAEIAISARKNMEVEELQACLVHQMVHYEQLLAGTAPAQRNFHNSVMLKRLASLGIDTVDKNGAPATPAAVVYNSVRPGSLVDLCMQDLPDEAIPEIDCNAEPPKTTTTGKRQKYICPVCGAAVWGKFGLHVRCGACDVDFVPVEPK